MRNNNATKRVDRRGGVMILFVAALVSALLTCEKVPDFCGTGELYDPSCAFCFGSRAYPLCSNGKYNPLVQGCDSTTNVIGTRCANGSVVPLGTPCGGYTLTVAATPADAGDVTYTPPAGTTYRADETVVLSASPRDRNEYEFAGWAGAQPTGGALGAMYHMKNSGSNPQVTIVAMFKPKTAGKLIADAFPQGAGEVTRNPPKDIYDKGDAVTVTARENAGYAFDGWSGASTSKNRSVTITMDDDSKTLVAIFTPVVHTLKATANPADGGAVYINNTAMLGGESRDVGAEVSLWAMPNEGYAFSRWTTGGGATFTDAGNPNTVVTLDADNPTITAVFTRGGGGAVTTEPPPPDTYRLTINKNIEGCGNVSLYPEGPTYNSGTRVIATVMMNASTECKFLRWTEAGSTISTETSVTIMMVGNKTVTAVFEKDGVTPPEPKAFTVTFDAKGGTVTPTYGTTSTGGKLAQLPTPTKTDYTFDGWYTAESGGDEVTVNTEFIDDATVYARWTFVGAGVQKYKVTVSYPLSIFSKGEYAAGTEVSISMPNLYVSPMETCRLFTRWTTQSAGVEFVNENDTSTSFTMPANDVTVTAAYNDWIYGVRVLTLYESRGTVSPASQLNVAPGTRVNITATANPGYTFDRWGPCDYGHPCLLTECQGGDTSTIGDPNSASTYIDVRGWLTVVAYFKSTSGKSEVVGDTLIDDRDGKRYRIVDIGSQTWMAENLNYQPLSGNSWCYEDNYSYCSQYGRLYDWATAMDINTSYNINMWKGSDGSDVKHQGVCPSGWHLPSLAEWTTLVNYVGSSAGYKLKSTSGWYGNGNGADDYGFSALPGDGRYSDGGIHMTNIGNNGAWWTATQYDSDFAYRRSIGYDNDYVYEDAISKNDGFSVRCIQD